MAALQAAGLPHSGTSGSKTACVSPELFAACRAFHRLPEPQASAVRPFLLSPRPPQEREGRIPRNCSAERIMRTADSSLIRFFSLLFQHVNDLAPE